MIKILLALALFSTNIYAASCRSDDVIRQFKKNNPCPTDFIVEGKCNAYVDHICALVVGGIDSIPNLQWQEIKLSKIKDKIEKTEEGKRRFCNSKNSTLTRQVFNCN